MVTESYPPGGNPSGPLNGPTGQPTGALPGGPTGAPPVVTPARSRRGRRTMIAGTVIIVVSLVVGITAAVVISSSVGRPLYEAFTNKTQATPVDTSLTLRQGRYTIFQLTGQESTRDPSSWNPNGVPPIPVEAVRITGPDGTEVPASSLGSSSTASGFGSSSEEINRNGQVFTGIVRFTTPAAGEYRVQITPADRAEVLIAPAFGSGVRAALAWVGAGALSTATFIIGVIVLIVGAVRRRRRPLVEPAWTGAQPVPGWYPAPDTPSRQRYWDGRTWTEHLR